MTRNGSVVDERGNVDGHCFELPGGVGGEADYVAIREARSAAFADLAPKEFTGTARREPQAQPQPAATTTSEKPVAALTAKQLISQLKARLRVVEREIRNRKQLERERDQIQRLISAATNERDNLRRIRVAG